MSLLSLISYKNPLAFLTALTLSRQRRRNFIETYQFPPGLRAKFARTKNFLNEGQQELVFNALRDYFIFCHQSGKIMVSMPSQIVDDAWHEFILFTREYHDFCLVAFGRYLHHTPAEAMQSKTQAQQGIKRVWRMACKKEQINSDYPDRLPLIFAIDGLLHIENGFIYSLNCLANNRDNYCATHIGCSSGCGGDSGSSASSGGRDGDGSGDNSSDSGSGGDSSCGGSSCGGGGCGGGGD